MCFFPLWEKRLNQFLETTAKEDHMCISTYQRSLDWNPLKAVDRLIRFVEADLNLVLISINNWMGPYQRTPFKKLLQLLDTHVFAGSVDRGSCWRFLGFEILTLLSLWKLKGKNHPKVSTLPGWMGELQLLFVEHLRHVWLKMWFKCDFWHDFNQQLKVNC